MYGAPCQHPFMPAVFEKSTVIGRIAHRRYEGEAMGQWQTVSCVSLMNYS